MGKIGNSNSMNNLKAVTIGYIKRWVDKIKEKRNETWIHRQSV